ncbi:hypothetical protein [Arundinibacter roseus]|uniref:Outer membrane protein beta-barrel domain-containing protein n=1 Tax=Arundinibacter roseus TaxID=2070510 RepID=A0A4R4JXM9_9BACT|nr:hypothetical protein [Arundinibacter roseus]TDB59554.1 hypothetical protein EZE20_22405 [Arundinibacter roseus]
MKKACITTFVILVICHTYSHAQIPDKFAFGIKAGLNYMDTRLAQRPKNQILYLTGVRGSDGYQAGVWASLPIRKWIFLDTDLEFSNLGQERYIPRTDTVVGRNRYHYLGLSTRLGATYRGAFVSLGPQINLQLNRNTFISEPVPVFWGLNARMGYQYRQIRAEVFYTKGLSHYDVNTENKELGRKILFFGKTVGFSLGWQLLGGKKDSR